MSDGIGLAEAMLGLDGFRVLEVIEGHDEVTITIETTADLVGCGGCGVRAESQDRVRVEIRDLPCFGRPCRLVWIKRRWRCTVPDCDAKTWTEHSDHLDAQVVLTRRAGAEACRQVGENARPVSQLATEMGVCWWTVMNAVVEHGTPLVDDPDRVGGVTQLGVDETSFLKANAAHSTIYATGLVDLGAHILIDMVEGNAAADLRRWVRQGRSGMAGGNRCGGHGSGRVVPGRAVPAPRSRHPCRRSVSCGARREPLPRQGPTPRAERDAAPPRPQSRPALSDPQAPPHRKRTARRARHRPDAVGPARRRPPRRVLGAWLAKESVRDVYLADNPADAEVLLDKAIAGCLTDDVDEIASLGNTLRSWRAEILAHHDTGASNGPTEGLNLCVKRVKRCGHGFRSFENYRLRVLLHAGGVTWPDRPSPPRIRARTPHPNA